MLENPSLPGRKLAISARHFAGGNRGKYSGCSVGFYTDDQLPWWPACLISLPGYKFHTHPRSAVGGSPPTICV